MIYVYIFPSKLDSEKLLCNRVSRTHIIHILFSPLQAFVNCLYPINLLNISDHVCQEKTLLLRHKLQ